MAGASVCSSLSAPRGIKSSFVNSFYWVGNQGVYDAEIKGKLAKDGRSIGSNTILQDRAPFTLNPQQQPHRD